MDRSLVSNRGPLTSLALADLEGACPAHVPQGSRFFCFDIQNLRNITASGVHAPPTRSTPLLRKILDPPLPRFDGYWHEMTHKTITFKRQNYVMFCSHEAYHSAHNHTQQVNGVLSNALHKMVDQCYSDTTLHFVEYQVVPFYN